MGQENLEIKWVKRRQNGSREGKMGQEKVKQFISQIVISGQRNGQWSNETGGHVRVK